MATRAILTLQDERKRLQADLQQFDQRIQDEQSDLIRESLTITRNQLQAQINEIDRTIGRLTDIQNGKEPSAEMQDGLVRLRPGQYRGMRKLVSAIQAYLSHCDPPGRPVKITFLTEQLNIGGVTVLMGRSKTPTKRRPVEPRDVRVAASNDAHHKTAATDGFFYGHTFRIHKERDEIGLIMERTAEVKHRSGLTGRSATSGMALAPAMG